MRICQRHLGVVPSTMLKDHSYQMVRKLLFLPSHPAELTQLCSRGYKRKVAGIHICKSPCLVSAYVAKVFTISLLQESTHGLYGQHSGRQRCQAENRKFRRNTTSQHSGRALRGQPASSVPWKKGGRKSGPGEFPHSSQGQMSGHLFPQPQKRNTQPARYPPFQ